MLCCFIRYIPYLFCSSVVKYLSVSNIFWLLTKFHTVTTFSGAFITYLAYIKTNVIQYGNIKLILTLVHTLQFSANGR